MPCILVCGLNGAGKSTVARLLAARLHLPFHDIEEYYFTAADGDPFAVSRSEKEAAALFAADLARENAMILAAVDGRFAPEVRFAAAVHLAVPREIRLARIRARSLAKFGDRARPGGDLFGREEAFFHLCASRKENRVTDWLTSHRFPALTLDGTQPPEYSASLAATWIDEIRQLFDTRP